MKNDPPLILSKAGIAAAGELPRRMMILRWGENPNANGVKVTVGEKLLDALADENCAFTTVALDFEHNTCPGSQAYADSAEPRAVAGYGRIVAERGKGVFLEMERWTPEGRKFAHHYEDLSAAPMLDERGEVVAVASVALCRCGAVPGITFAASPLSTITQGTQKQTNKENTMDYRAILLKLLDLPEDASDEAVAAALEKIKNNRPAEETPPETGAEAQVLVQPEGGVEPLAARIEALEKRADQAEKSAILADARAAGKVVALSADALATLSVAQLRETVEKTPVTVPLSAKTPGTVREKAAAPAPDPEKLRIFSLCGVEATEAAK